MRLTDKRFLKEISADLAIVISVVAVSLAIISGLLFGIFLTGKALEYFIESLELFS